MPFTPFHTGPGLAVKALTGRHLSLMVFGFAQVAMDIEPLVRIMRGDAVLHGLTHTYLGATLIALASAVLGRPVCQFLLDRWKPDFASDLWNGLRGPPRIAWRAALCGAFVGTYSHVLLDSLMHSDMAPLAPLSALNGALHAISVENLHLACALSALLGGSLMLLAFFCRRRAASGL